MGAIVSDFPSLPADADPNRAARYAGVYSDLAVRGLSIPVTASDAITRAALLAHLQTLAGVIIKAELQADPQALYSGAATDALKATAISDGYTKVDARTGATVFQGSRMNQIFVRFPHAPNAITAADVTAALV